jgi:hypothetical protein
VPKKFDIMKTKSVTLIDSEGLTRVLDISLVEKIPSVVGIYHLRGNVLNTLCSGADVAIEVRSASAFSCKKKCCDYPT